MWLLTFVRLLLAVLSLRGNRWACIAFMALGLLYFPMSAGFRFNSHPCELTPSLSLAIFSLTNYAHIVLFAFCFVIISAQFRESDWSAFVSTAMLTIVMGGMVEAAQGITGKGHCRLRDLIPDTAGALVGSGIVLLLRKIGWRPNPSWTLMRWGGGDSTTEWSSRLDRREGKYVDKEPPNIRMQRSARSESHKFLWALHARPLMRSVMRIRYCKIK